MRWSEGAYFATWLTMIGNDERLDHLYDGDDDKALAAIKSLRDDYKTFRENEEMNNYQERA